MIRFLQQERSEVEKICGFILGFSHALSFVRYKLQFWTSLLPWGLFLDYASSPKRRGSLRRRF